MKSFSFTKKGAEFWRKKANHAEDRNAQLLRILGRYRDLLIDRTTRLEMLLQNRESFKKDLMKAQDLISSVVDDMEEEDFTWGSKDDICPSSEDLLNEAFPPVEEKFEEKPVDKKPETEEEKPVDKKSDDDDDDSVFEDILGLDEKPVDKKPEEEKPVDRKRTIDTAEMTDEEFDKYLDEHLDEYLDDLKKEADALFEFEDDMNEPFDEDEDPFAEPERNSEDADDQMEVETIKREKNCDVIQRPEFTFFETPQIPVVHSEHVEPVKIQVKSEIIGPYTPIPPPLAGNLEWPIYIF